MYQMTRIDVRCVKSSRAPHRSAFGSTLLQTLRIRSSHGDNVPRATAAMGFDEVTMSRVRVVGAVRVHGAFGVRQLARGNIRVTSTASGVTESNVQRIVRWSEGDIRERR